MKILKIPFDKIPQLSKRDIAYVNENAALRPFYKYPVSLESFRQVIADKSKERTNRGLLVEVLREQYAQLDLDNPVGENIEKLTGENTFTVVTAHQPSLFTGPLYYIYKIVSTLNLAKELSAHFPDFQFVPVFITGGEDHDFEEVNHLHLFNKTLTWESGESGSVGQMKTASLQPVLAELKQILGTSEPAQKLFALLEKTHLENTLYSEATVAMVYELFKDEGLVCLNMSHKKLKQFFVPVIKEEILEQSSAPIVAKTIGELEAVGFPGQAPPREINFFYLREQLRERIVLENGTFKVLHSDYQFSKEEIIREIESHPERFSPNVVMRPLYQELVLPNLAYIGGGGEIAYWLERKVQFEHFDINFPMLIRRNSALWIDRAAAKRMDKLGLSSGAIFGDVEDLVKEYVKRNSGEELSLKSEKESLNKLFASLASKTSSIDATLVKTVWAEHAKQLKSLEQLEMRLLRAEKQKHETALNQLRALKEKLFPKYGLQERYDNFLPFYLRYGPVFFEILKDNLHPLEKGFVVVADA